MERGDGMSYKCKENQKTYTRTKKSRVENYWNGHFAYADVYRVCWNCKHEYCLKNEVKK